VFCNLRGWGSMSILNLDFAEYCKIGITSGQSGTRLEGNAGTTPQTAADPKRSRRRGSKKPRRALGHGNWARC